MAKRRTAAKQPMPLETLRAAVWTHPDQSGPMRELWRKRKDGGLLTDEEAAKVWDRLKKGSFVFELPGNETKEKDDG